MSGQVVTEGFAAVVAYLRVSRMGRLRAIQCNSFSDVILTHPAMLDLSNRFVNHQAS
jgi:hypothetical protein